MDPEVRGMLVNALIMLVMILVLMWCCVGSGEFEAFDEVEESQRKIDRSP